MDFFQTIKRCCQVHVQATSLLKRNKHWNAFRVWLYEKHLVRLGGYPAHGGVADMSYFFHFYFVFIYDQTE